MLSVAQYYVVHGKKHLLESALLLVGWTPDSIRIMFEEEASALLVRFLDSFRPVTATSKAGKDLCYKCHKALPISPCSEHISVYLKNRDMALNEGYRKYFPEEEEEIRGVVNKYDRRLPVLDHDLPVVNGDLPAVNGITQEFWD